MGEIQPASHRAILAVDVEAFAARTNVGQFAVHKAMFEALRQSLVRAGISWTDSVVEDRGDGALILLPPESPKSLLVTVLPTHLAAALAQHNADCPVQERIRMRMAVHAGEVYRNARGFTGASINQVFRLLDAPEAKAALRSSPGVIELIVSDWFYNEIVRHHLDARPSSFRQILAVTKKETIPAWLRVFESQKTPNQQDTRQAGGESVFISYSRPDSKFAQTLARRLSEAGVSVFWDMNLPAGADFSKVLTDAIGTADFVIALVSPDYLASNWAQAELSAALSSQKRVLPILVRRTVLEGPLQYIQFLDATSEPHLAGEKVIELLGSTQFSTPFSASSGAS